MKKSILALTLLTSINAFATEDEQSNVTFSLTTGYVFGGDTVGELIYEDDDSESIKAGQGVILGGGLSYEFNSKWAVDISANYHLDTATAKNGDLSFERLAFNVIPYYGINDSFSVGLGLGLHTNVELSNDFGSDVEFSNETAFISSLRYHFETISADLELRHTRVEYSVDRIGSSSFSSYDVTVDGNNTGLLFHWKF
ncbi:outer membrane beta-barrel protein [Pseudoalteromonas luteoviolacea]|uniref:outer membrane beta-barrel protein n=1 Tax=Pseudoalteromonas luteoviolacea TaxID=43657 RepID=UPI001150A508|nr:outer membrane beta-barrel protein [Pseudoalteromonas luteoviolacea]TQF72782.1 outer membrane beta-barrel protein [Pseudoalteromonas luteoviolacea]